DIVTRILELVKQFVFAHPLHHLLHGSHVPKTPHASTSETEAAIIVHTWNIRALLER
ncbi:Hypothetical protein FKW44_014512, partial [Caligus rogercresseyi]